MATTSDELTTRQMFPVIAASTIGTAIEWYDFFLYGTVAALVFPKLFFPTKTDPVVATLLSLSTILVGFIARPIGGALFGHLGDRIGRKSTLVATLLLMGISTFVIGFMPGYASIGLLAPLIVSILRFLQGLGVGGEWGGSVLLALEYGHKRNRGLWASFPQAGVPVGLLLSAGLVAIFSAVAGEQGFASWGWRVPFFISAALIIVGLYIRLRIFETPLFAEVKAQGREAKAPVVDVIAKNPVEIILSAGARFTEQAPFYIFTTFVLVYGKDLKLNGQVVLAGVYIAAIVELFTIPLFGYISDRVGRRKWYLVGCALMAAFGYPYFLLFNTKNSALVILAIVLSLALFHAWVYGPQAALISERFGTRTRYSGASLGYQLAAPFAGGLAPIIAVGLLAGTVDLFGLKIQLGGSWPAIANYIIVLGLISFVSVLGLREMSKADISQEVPVAVSAAD
jgi:MFS family permease